MPDSVKRPNRNHMIKQGGNMVKKYTVWHPESTDPAAIEKEWLEKRKTLLTASDASAALGDNPFKTTVELWEEKTGKRKPADLSGNPNVQYGIENEDRIRKEFAEKNKSWMKMHYAARDILISKEYPYLGATLDGIIEITSYNNPLGLPKGEMGIWECKTHAFSTRDDYDSWKELPLNYREQVVQQIIVSWFKFAITTAELRFDGDEDFQGNLPDKDVRDYIFMRDTLGDAIPEFLSRTGEFWKHVLDGTIPTVSLNSNDKVVALVDPEVPRVDVELKAETKMGEFIDNFDVIQSAIQEMVEPYQGLVFTPEQTKDAKKIRTELRKKRTTIDDMRKSLKKEYCKPLDKFEARAKNLCSIIDDAIAPIDAQIKEQEEREREDNRRFAEQLFVWAVDTRISDPDLRAFFRESGFDEIQDKWLLKSTSKNTITEAMGKIVDEFIDDMTAIEQHAAGNATLLTVMRNAYADSHKLSFAITAKDRFMEQLEAQKRRQEMLERQKAEEEARAQEEAQQVQPAPEPDPEKHEGPKEIVLTFRAAHTSGKEWADLIKYMAKHGFRYEQVK